MRNIFKGCAGGEHQFEARYDEMPRDIDHFKGRYTSTEVLKALLNYRVYVKDVCIHCGKEIRR